MELLVLIVKDWAVTQLVGGHCHVEHPFALLRLSEIDEIVKAEVQHLLNLLLIVLEDVVHQAVDLQRVLAARFVPAVHRRCRPGAAGGKRQEFIKRNSDYDR